VQFIYTIHILRTEATQYQGYCVSTVFIILAKCELKICSCLLANMECNAVVPLLVASRVYSIVESLVAQASERLVCVYDCQLMRCKVNLSEGCSSCIYSSCFCFFPISLLEECFVTKDPFSPDGERFLILGSNCSLCHITVCVGTVRLLILPKIMSMKWLKSVVSLYNI
jgi:hypothetical protein